MVNVVQRKKLRKEKLSSKCVYISDLSTRKCLDDIPKKHTRDTFRTTTVDLTTVRVQTWTSAQRNVRRRRLLRRINHATVV
jgi:hypothetical protein